MDSMDLIAFSIKDMQATYKKWSLDNVSKVIPEYSLSQLEELRKEYAAARMSAGTLDTIRATIYMHKEMISFFQTFSVTLDMAILLKRQQNKDRQR